MSRFVRLKGKYRFKPFKTECKISKYGDVRIDITGDIVRLRKRKRSKKS